MTFEYELSFFNNIVCQSHLDKSLTTLGMISYISLPVSRALYRGGEIELGTAQLDTVADGRWVLPPYNL